jgi:DNA repair protein RecO (recombination protein O)
MSTEAFEALVLHKRPSGDASMRITFFTREKGVLTCLCKGGRTPKKQAILQPFTSLWLAIDTRKDWYYVRSIESTAISFELKGKVLFAGLYLNELLYYALAPIDSYPELFDVYLLTLRGLTTTTDRLVIEALLRRFEYVLLSACGYAVSFTEEACSVDAIASDKQYQFIASTGFIASNEGNLSGRDILAFAQGQLSDLKVLKAAKIIMRQAIKHLLGERELKSRSLYQNY